MVCQAYQEFLGFINWYYKMPCNQRNNLRTKRTLWFKCILSIIHMLTCLNFLFPSVNAGKLLFFRDWTMMVELGSWKVDFKDYDLILLMADLLMCFLFHQSMTNQFPVPAIITVNCIINHLPTINHRAFPVTTDYIPSKSVQKICFFP